MSHLWEYLVTLLFLSPSSYRTRDTQPRAPENWEKYRFPFPARRPFRSSSTEAWLCFTRSLIPLPKRHFRAWPNWIRGVPWHIGAWP